MIQSSLKDAQALFDNYLPKTGDYYKNNRNYSFDVKNKSHTTSLLSPYVRYRLISEEDILKKTLDLKSFFESEKFIQEIYWRTYWKGWLEHRQEVYDDYLLQRDKLLCEFINTKKYLKVINGDSKLDFFNNWVIELKNNAYLHNHVRMWFASIWIFTLNLPWQLGANFFMENLLDGDPASNTLSWRWVAGIQTKGKHYLARKKNIMKFSNITISNDIQLNENTNYLTENKHYLLKDLQLSSDEITDLDSILIPSDELNFIINYKYKFKNIFSGIPFNDYNDHNFSPKVLNHIKKIIVSNFEDNEFYRDNNYELYFEDYYNEFKKWIKKYKIKQIALPYVAKGNWNKIYKKLIYDNSSVNFVYLHRKYDKEAWKFTKKGFFNFKKHIPELLTKL